MKNFKTLLTACAFAAAGLQQAEAAVTTVNTGLILSTVAAIPFSIKEGKIDTSLWYISSGWTDGPIQGCEWLSNAVTMNGQNIKITLSNKGGSLSPYGCGEVQSIAKTQYGRYEVSMKTAAGSGLNSTFFTYTGTPTHDEIDFEFLGKNSKTVQVNYFVNGVNTGGVSINLGFDASAAFHTYSFEWRPNSIIWYVDGKAVYQSKAGAKIPKYASKMYLSLWSGSKLENGWLGPFTYNGPVSAEYQFVKFTPMSPNGLIPK